MPGVTGFFGLKGAEVCICRFATILKLIKIELII
jgi:hypothetical protein